MAKETVYNNTLVSGAADETLTYTRYVKDESSGKSTKELLDEKVNKTDQLGTTQIADKAVTTEKLENESVTTDKLDAASVTTDKVADANITTSKLADSSVETEKINNKAVTTDKLNDGAVDNTKLSPNAVTSEKIKDESIITEKLNDRAVTTEKVEEKAITNAKLGDQSVDGRVVREASLETKHFANESVTTEKVARKSITKDKLADNSVDASQLVDGSIGNAKLSPDSVTTEKIKDGSVTNEKIADNTLGIGKFDPELRKTIQAATGLPDDLNQMIQDVDQSVKQLHEKDTDLQSQIDDKQQQITANDDDISLLQTRSTQMEEAIKGISASGGASQASAVTYENTESGLDSVTAQGAIDELANKNKSQDTEIGKKANSADVDSQIQTEQERVNAELDKKFNKENIAQEFGDSEDKVVSQFALPFREIESPEFIKVIVDAEDHFLLGIQLDGSIEWGKGIPAPIRQRIQEVLNYVGDEFASLSDKIESIKLELSGSLQTYQQTTDATLANLQDTKVDKEEGKSLIEDVVKECFRVIENEEFIKAIVDSDDKILFGFYRETGEPYYPLNEMYHVIQNEEYFAAWVTTDDKVALGIRRDGEIIGEIHAVNALKQVISQLQSDVASLQEKVGTIDTNLKELLDVFSLQDNEEYLAVEQDAEGKVLSATNADGSHYIHNAKSETIPTELSHIEDPEGRTEITTDAENKILGYRDSEGTRHEHKISASHINLSDEAAKEVNEAFKSAGIKMENPSDFSKDSHIELPIPRIAAQVKIYAPRLPITKKDNIEAEIEYNDKDGNYFRKPVILNAQGNSSMAFPVKNLAIDLSDESKIKFGDFPSQDSFHLKKYYMDIFRGQCVACYWLMEQVYQTRPVGKKYPYELLSNPYNPIMAEGSVDEDFYTGSKCHPDGFPIIITWINSVTQERKEIGIYSWNLKKSKEVYHANKKKAENIVLDGVIGNSTLFNGVIDWSQFEIRNPKPLVDINGKKYDGDNPKELSDSDSLSKKVKDYLIRLSAVKTELKTSNTKETFEKYFIVPSFIDYFLVSQVIYNIDGYKKNWIWCTWDGKHWTPTLYDVDSVFGIYWDGTYIIPESDVKNILGIEACNGLNELYMDEIKARYKQLRDANIFSTENITGLLQMWLDRIGYSKISDEIKLYPETPSYRASYIGDGWKIVGYSAEKDNYDIAKTYNIGERCSYKYYLFEAVKNITGVSPFEKIYEDNPKYSGCYNSVKRVAVWLENRIKFLDNIYSYNK